MQTYLSIGHLMLMIVLSHVLCTILYVPRYWTGVVW